MKKILLSTIVLTAFSLSIILFQISCKKSADAQTPTNTGITQQNKIIWMVQNYSTAHPTLGQIWTANYDGTNQQQINVTLPSGLHITSMIQPEISPDGKTIFFSVQQDSMYNTSNYAGTYSCNSDGSNAKQILSNAAQVRAY